MISVELVEKEFLPTDGPVVIHQVKISDVEADYTVWLDPQQADQLADELIAAVAGTTFYDSEPFGAHDDDTEQ